MWRYDFAALNLRSTFFKGTGYVSYLRSGLALALIAGGLLFSSPVWAQPKENISAANVLPPTTVLYVEAGKPSEMVEIILNHPLRKRIEASPAYQEAVPEDGLRKLRQGVAMFEAGMQQPWPEAIAALTQGGAVVAYDGKTRGVVALIQADEPDTLEKLRSSIGIIAKLANAKNGDRFKEGSYREAKTMEISPNVKMAFVDHWMMITNRSELGQVVVDNILDGTEQSLANVPEFASAKEKQPDECVWGFADIGTIRDAGGAEQLYAGQTDNVLAEILFGGIVANLKYTPYATAALKVDQFQVSLEVAVPSEAEWSEGREYFFGEDGNATAPPLLKPEGTLLALSAHRDLSQMWLRSGDLLTEKGSEQLAKADSTLTTLFSGKDFGEDILSALDDQVQLVVITRDFEGMTPSPAIKLPAFAVQFGMKDRETTEPEFRRVFQSFIGFLNVVGVMNGQPQLDLGDTANGEANLYHATYVPNAADPEDTAAEINYNFSPTLGFKDNRMVLASSTDLAQTLFSNSEDLRENGVVGGNTLVHVSGPAIAKALEPNKELLIAQNMLEKGHDRQAAEGEISILFQLIELVREAAVQLDHEEGQLKLSARVMLNVEQEP